MNGRCLTRGLGNVQDVTIPIRNNIHESIIYIYGIQQNETLSADIKMSLVSNIIARLLLFIKLEIYIDLSVNELEVLVHKYMSANIPMVVQNIVKVALDKYLSAKIPLDIKSNLRIQLDKQIRGSTLDADIQIGTINRGKTLADFSGLTLSDLSGLIIGEMGKGVENVYGLKVGLIKRARLSDYAGQTLLSMSGKTIEELSFARIK